MLNEKMPSLFTVMLTNDNDFNLVVRQADKKGSVFSVNPERIYQPMLRLQKFCIQRRMGRVVLKKSFCLFPLFRETMVLDILFDVLSKVNNNWHGISSI
jgi:hypothetical protein